LHIGIAIHLEQQIDQQIANTLIIAGVETQHVFKVSTSIVSFAQAP